MDLTMQILVKTDFQVSCYCKILNVSDHCRFLFKHQGFPWVGGVQGWPKRTFLPKTWSLVSSATWDGLWRHIIAIIFSTKPAIGKLIWQYGYIAHIHDNQWLDKVKNHAWPNQKCFGHTQEWVRLLGAPGSSWGLLRAPWAPGGSSGLL